MKAKPLITAGPGKELESGLFPSVDPLSAPFWHTGENVEFRAGGVATNKGFILLATGPGTIKEMQQAFHEGDKRIYTAVGADVFNTSNITGLDLLGSFSGDTGTPMFETYGSFLLATDNVDPIKAWRNTGTLDAITGSPSAIPFSRARILKRKGPHILAFNTNLGQNHVAWCSADDIDDWVATSANSAGDIFIRDLDSDIIAAIDLAARIAVYSKDSLAFVDYVGQPAVFGYKYALNGVGAVGRHSVIPVGPLNYGLNRQGIFRTDGFSFQYLDDPAVNEVIQLVDFDLSEGIVGYNNEDRETVTWYYTSLGAERLGISFDYRKNVFEILRAEVAMVLERQVYAKPVAAVGSALMLMNSGEDANTEALVKWARTKPLSASDAASWKAWSHLKLVGTWNNAFVKIGVITDPNNLTIDWISTQDLDYELWIDYESPFLVLEFRAEALGAYFNISQIQLMGNIMAGDVSA